MSSPVLQCVDTIELLNFNFIAYQCEIWLTWLSTSYRLLRPSRGFLKFWLLTYLHWTKPSINASHGSLLVNNQFLILKPIKLVPPCLLLTHSRSWLRGLKCWRPIMIVITRLLLFQHLRKTFLAEGWKFSHWPLCRIWPLFKRLKQYEHYYCYLNWQYNTQLTSTVNDILFNTSAIIKITKIKDTPCISISLNQEALNSFDNWNFSSSCASLFGKYSQSMSKENSCNVIQIKHC